MCYTQKISLKIEWIWAYLCLLCIDRNTICRCELSLPSSFLETMTLLYITNANLPNYFMRKISVIYTIDHRCQHTNDRTIRDLALARSSARAKKPFDSSSSIGLPTTMHTHTHTNMLTHCYDFGAEENVLWKTITNPIWRVILCGSGETCQLQP